MASVSIDVTAPGWAQRFAATVTAALAILRSELHAQPLRPAQFQAADLPDPTRWPGCLIAVWDGAAFGLRLSDGAAWRAATLEP